MSQVNMPRIKQYNYDIIVRKGIPTIKYDLFHLSVLKFYLANNSRSSCLLAAGTAWIASLTRGDRLSRKDVMWTDWWMFSTSFNKFIGHFSDRNWCDNESSLVTKDIEKKDGEVETGKESEGGK